MRPVAAIQAAEKGRSLDEELQFLTTHGFLHLIGHDHQEPADEERMFALQDALFADWQGALAAARRNGARP